jgi:hypothetical protein
MTTDAEAAADLIALADQLIEELRTGAFRGMGDVG